MASETVKGQFTNVDGSEFKTYWNGKRYGKGVIYVTATPMSGSSVKVTYDPDRGISVGAGRTREFGRKALESVGIEFE